MAVSGLVHISQKRFDINVNWKIVDCSCCCMNQNELISVSKNCFVSFACSLATNAHRCLSDWQVSLW